MNSEGWVVLGVFLIGGWILILFTKSGREHLREHIRRNQAFETKRTKGRGCTDLSGC